MHGWLGAGAIALATATVAGSASAQEGPRTVDYVVKAGDTCTSVTLAHYGGDRRAIKLFHEANPQLGPPPHYLAPGQVLHFPPRGPDAHVSFIKNEVEAFTPREHRARVEEPLVRGNRVDTLADSAAELTFSDDTRLQLGEHTLVVILGRSAGKAQASGSDTALLNGSLRAHLDELSGGEGGSAPPATLGLSTSGGHKVLVEGGDVLVDLDAEKTTRLAVHAGKSSLESSGKKVVVPDGYGSKALKEQPPTPPRPLPPAPVWKTALPPVMIQLEGEGLFEAAYAAGTGGPPTAQFHVQLARDARFNDTIVDAKVPNTITGLKAEHLTTRAYFARVAAIDGDRFEGKPTAVARVDLVVGRLTRPEGKNPTLTLPPEAYCGLDGAPLAHVTAPIELARFEPHLLRCSLAPSGGPVGEMRVAPRRVSFVGVRATLHDVNREERTAKVTLTLTDADGGPISGVDLTATASNRARIGVLAASPTAGTYEAPFAWEAGTSKFFVHVGVNGLVEGESNMIVVPAPPAPQGPIVAAPPEPPPVVVDLGLFAGVGVAADDLGAGPAVGGELAMRAPFAGWSASIGLRPRLETYRATTDATCAAGASGIPAACQPPRPATQYSYSLRETMFTLAFPLTARVGERDAGFAPYLTLEPGLLVDHASVEASIPGRTVRDGDTLTRLSLGAFLGAEIRATEQGRFFLEAGLRGSPTETRAWGDSTLTSVLVTLGWRGGL